MNVVLAASAVLAVVSFKDAAKHPKQDHWLRHYVGTRTNVRPPDSVKYFHA